MTTHIDITTPEQRWVAFQVESLNSRALAKLIKSELRRRSGKSFSVKCGSGTSRSWITIRPDGEAQRLELAKLMGRESVHFQGESIPASAAYRRVALAQAAFGSTLGFTASQYWD